MKHLIYLVLHGVAWLLNHLVCRYHVSGLEHVPQEGPLLLVANHLSWFDPLLLYGILPRQTWFFTKSEIFKLPIIGWLCRITGQIPVHRGSSDRAALERALAYIREGRALLIFPEGMVVSHERLVAAHSGAAMLALRSGARVLPIAHTGTRRILRSFSRSSIFPRVTIQIGAPFTPTLPAGSSRKEELQAVTRQIMLAIAALLPEESRGAYTLEREPTSSR